VGSTESPEKTPLFCSFSTIIKKKKNNNKYATKCPKTIINHEKTHIEKDDEEQPYDSMSDPDIETDEKPVPPVVSKVVMSSHFDKQCAVCTTLCF